MTVTIRQDLYQSAVKATDYITPIRSGAVFSNGNMGTWWWKWSSILKVLKVTSSQCVYNVSKKKLWMEFSIFHLSYQFLMKVARHVQSTKIGSLLNFSNILRKVLQRLLCSIGMQNIQILYWIPVMFVVTYFWVAVVKKMAWPFRSLNSEICCISREWMDKMNWFFCMLIQI